MWVVDGKAGGQETVIVGGAAMVAAVMVAVVTAMASKVAVVELERMVASTMEDERARVPRAVL